MHKSHFNEHGLEKNIFKRFEKVISGIFTRSQMMVKYIIVVLSIR